MPDVFVPNDTSGITKYYYDVVNAGLLQKFAFEYTDKNRAALSQRKKLPDFMANIPDDDELLQQFVAYAVQKGIPARWYYINISRNLIVKNLKALIASDILGREYLYQVINDDDATVKRAIAELDAGNATAPIKPDTEQPSTPGN